MDWISTTTGCFAVSNAVTKTAIDLNRFVRDVRESRADLARLSAELHALDGVLDLLKDDAASAAFPADLALQTPAVVASSGALVAELGVILGGGDRDSSSEKRSRWLAMQQHIAESRSVLEVYRLTLGLALDLVALFSSRYPQPHDDSAPIANANAKDLARILAEIGHLRIRVRSDLVDDDAIFLLQNYLNVLQRHAQNAATEAEAVREPEPEPSRDVEADSASETEVAATDNNSVEAVDAAVPGPSFARETAAASPIGKAPDSAVEMMDDEGESETRIQEGEDQSQTQNPSNSLQAPQLPTASSSAYSLPSQRSSSPPPPPPPPPRGRINGPALLPSCEINDLMDELRDELPSRPPTPPPKAVARGSSALGFYPGGPPSNGSSPSSIRPAPNILTAPLPPTPPAPPPQINLPLRPYPPMAAPMGQLSRSVSNSNMGRRPLNNSNTATTVTTSTPPQSNARFGRFLRHIRSASATTPAELDRRPATATGVANVSAFAPTPLTNIPSNASNSSHSASSNSNGSNGNLAVTDRRASHRFSATFRTPWTVTTMIQGGNNTNDNNSSNNNNGNNNKPSNPPAKSAKKKWSDKADNEPDAVFGVSLRKSIHMAGSSARTHHNGSHGASRREFPLCIFKCYSFIRSNNGLDTPDIFGGGVPGLSADDADPASSLDIVNPDRVRALCEHFSTPPLYGADLDDAKLASAIVIESGSGAVLSHRGYSRHDAAALILQYLEQLPKPLVPEAVARRWVALSRQATLPGSYAKRLDQCIDFWEEALGGIRGPARSLLKLLLNLWGDIADAAERNDMTAERLAGRVLRPLMHIDGGRHETDYMLSLAFVIRKRSEYALLLRGGGRKSNAAFEA
ncbi:hypothetical protein SBRCBS47491_001165 [Sporothrix bragantina]|uniref:Rho-GAP domain-containing protein n=1 Tax=Sporothrix bragantina TaxID=671064 RepID=A0ABP0AWA0_9PEZI